MKDEYRKYIESERKLNEQLIQQREFAMKFVKLLIISSIIGIIATIIGLIFFI